MCAHSPELILRPWHRLGRGLNENSSQESHAASSVTDNWAFGLKETSPGCKDGPSDSALLDALSGGDREALAIFFGRYASVVGAVGLKVLRDPAEAEDLVQEVFLFVFRKAALFDSSRGSARSWLVQIAYHRAFDRRRYLASRRVYSNVQLDQAILSSEEPAVLSTFYDDSIEAALGRDVLRRIAESLTPVQSRVVYLVFVEGRTIGEIAALLGQTPGNVRNHYYRALEKMRREVFGGKSEPK